MIPRNASRESPSVSTMAIILQRANVRVSVVALACCVLDCLSDQMLRQWRRDVCTMDGRPEQSELLAVTALTIAMKFLEDSVRHPWTFGHAPSLEEEKEEKSD